MTREKGIKLLMSKMKGIKFSFPVVSNEFESSEIGECVNALNTEIAFYESFNHAVDVLGIHNGEENEQELSTSQITEKFPMGTIDAMKESLKRNSARYEWLKERVEVDLNF